MVFIILTYFYAFVNMKKRTKIWLGLAMILIFAGISLCLAAFAMGLNYKDLSGMAYHGVFHFDEWFDDVQLDSIDVTSDNKSVENTNQAEALMIELDYGKLTILSTDRSNAYLEVSTKEDEKYFRFNESNRTIRVYTPDNIIGIHSTDSPEATLYIPENISFEYIEISVLPQENLSNEFQLYYLVYKLESSGCSH